MSRILVCDDEPHIVRALKVVLREAGFEAVTAETGGEALDRAAVRPPDAAILDLVLPDIDGIEVCRRLREWTEMPILVLSAVGDEEEKVRALEAGADDYVVKPFAIEEITARLHALLRRRPAAPSADEVLEVGDIRLDPRAHAAERAGRDLELTRRELELLALFLRHPGEVLDRRRLHEEVWGYTFDPQTNVADVFVGYLRRKLEAAGEPRVIQTVRGVGFVLRG